MYDKSKNEKRKPTPRAYYMCIHIAVELEIFVYMQAGPSIICLYLLLYNNKLRVHVMRYLFYVRNPRLL